MNDVARVLSEDQNLDIRCATGVCVSPVVTARLGLGLSNDPVNNVLGTPCVPTPGPVVTAN